MKLKKTNKAILLVICIAVIGYLTIALCYNAPIKAIGAVQLNNRIIQERIRQDVSNLNTEIEIEEYCLKLTSKLLYFTDKQEFKSISSLTFNKEIGAHCVGYSQVCTAICNYAFKQKGMKHCQARHMRGDVILLGIPLNSILKWSFNQVGMHKLAVFCQDHDYVEVTNSGSCTVVSFDPSIYDMLGLDLRHKY